MYRTYLYINLCIHIPIISLAKIPRNEIAEAKNMLTFITGQKCQGVSLKAINLHAYD